MLRSLKMIFSKQKVKEKNREYADTLRGYSRRARLAKLQESRGSAQKVLN
jgi:hypothetical protein